MKHVLVCDRQPLVAMGVKALLGEHDQLRFADSTESLPDALKRMLEKAADLVILDKGFGTGEICGWLDRLEENRIKRPSVVVWGTTSPGETLHLLRAGVRGIIEKTAKTSALLACLQTVALGRTWLEDHIFGDHKTHPQVALTAREQDVLDQLQRGLSNKNIASALGIQPGTVKIHLRHIFDKTGIRGRHYLAMPRLPAEVDRNIDIPVIRAHSLAVA